MEHTPFGGSSVRDQRPYFGAVVVSRATEGDDPPRNGGLTKGQEEALCKGTWDRPLPKIKERALALHLAKVSPSRTAAAWNAYLISLVPYAAHYAPPDVGQE
eukprot:7594722-Pyramimonas_sp.AAC.1